MSLLKDLSEGRRSGLVDVQLSKLSKSSPFRQMNWYRGEVSKWGRG